MINPGRFALIATALLLAVPAAAASPDAGGEDYQRWIDGSLSGNYLAARHAARHRDFAAASRFFDNALSLDPDNSRLLNRAFVFQASVGNWTKADYLARRVIRRSPRHRLARIVLGLRAAAMSDFTGAESHFRESAYTPVGELTGGLLIAWARAARNDFEGAMEAMRMLEGNDAFTGFRLFHSALIAEHLGHNLQAGAFYEQAYRRVPGSLRATLGLAGFHARTGRRDKAREVYEAFLKSAPDNDVVRDALKRLGQGETPPPLIANAREGMAEALFSLASALTDERSIDIALVYTRLTLRMRPGFPLALMLMGEIYENTKRQEKAVTVYDRIPRAHPLYLSAQIRAALSLSDLDRKEEAIRRLHRLAKRFPDSWRARMTLANVLRSAEKWEAAAAAYTRALELIGQPQKRHWVLFYFRGIAHERAGRWPEAEKDFRFALKLNPGHPSVLNYLGYSLIDRGEKLNEALAMVRQAVDARPNDGYIVDSLGWAYYRLKKYDEAVRYLERAVELRPADPVINDHLGDAYWMVGRRLEARFQWQHALDSKPEEKLKKKLLEKLKSGLEVPEKENGKTAAAPADGNEPAHP